MSKLIMLKGLPASGKSTWALEQVRASSGRIKRVNKDELRAMVDGGGWSKANERFVLDIRDRIVSGALFRGLDVIVDDTNFAPAHEKQLRHIAENQGAEFEIKAFNTPIEDCIARDGLREKPVGEKVIRNMAGTYLNKTFKSTDDWVPGTITPNLSPDSFVPIGPVYDPNLPSAIICDIDGTLAHMVSRGPYDWKRVGEDRLDEPVKLILRLFRTYGDRIIIMSGRDGVCAPETKKWLDMHDIPYHTICMRAEGDNRKDNIVKEELYRRHVEGQYNVRFVLDDRDQVVKMWRDLGLQCLQVAPGNF